MTSVTSPSPQIAPAAPVNHQQEAPRQDAPDKPSSAQTEAATRKPDEWLEELPEVEPKIALAVRGGPRHVEPNLQVKPAGFDVTDYLRLGPSGIREKTGVPEFGDSLSSRIDVGRGQRRLARVELGKADLRIGVDHRLLVDPPHALQGADIEGVLRQAVAGVLAVELAMGLLVELGLLQRHQLAFGINW